MTAIGKRPRPGMPSTLAASCSRTRVRRAPWRAGHRTAHRSSGMRRLVGARAPSAPSTSAASAGSTSIPPSTYARPNASPVIFMCPCLRPSPSRPRKIPPSGTSPILQVICQEVRCCFPSIAIAGIGRYARALASPRRPLLVQLVVTRRCNLSCGYCYEYRRHVRPGRHRTCSNGASTMPRALGTLVLTLTGGEPLLHPKLDAADRARGVATGSSAR